VTYFSVLLTFIAESFITLVISVRQGPSTRRTTPLTLTHGFSVQCALLVIVETRVACIVPIAFRTGNSNVGERARKAGHAVATRLVAGVRNVTSTCLVETFTRVLSSRGSSKVSDHMIMPFNFVIK